MIKLSFTFFLTSSFFLLSLQGNCCTHTNGTTDRATEATTLTFSHSTSGIDRILIVGVASNGGSVNSITYNGSSLTLLGAISNADVRTEMWFLVAPTTGVNNVLVTMDSDRTFAVGANSYNGVNQITPFSSSSTASGQSTVPTITITSSIGELVVDALGVKEADPTVGAGQIQRTERESEEATWHSTSEEFGAASVTMNYTLGGAKDWAIVGGSLVCSNSPLPIELLSFHAVPVDQGVNLTWVTSSESDNDYFDLQRSSNGIDFVNIAKINGAGNSVVELEYSSYDYDPLIGTSYYRLRQVDYNGEYSFSKVISINLNGIEFITIYPNPSNGEINYTINSSVEGEIELKVYDRIGRMVHVEKFTVGKGLKHLSTFTVLNQGVYSIQISHAREGFFSSEYIVIQ